MLTNEIFLEILRHFTRKHLCRTLYLVNRQFHQLANSHRQVPVIHQIPEILFSSPNHIRMGEPFTITIASPQCADGYYETFTVEQLPVPAPFIRFRQVSIFRCQPEQVVKFMEDSKESFVDCKLRISISDFLPANQVNQPLECGHIQDQTHDCLQNVFYKPLWIKITDTHWISEPKFILETKGMVSCKKLELHWLKCLEGTKDALVDWLNSGEESRPALGQLEASSALIVAKKHLVLVHYPREIILEIIQQVKQDFETNVSNCSDFLATFVECEKDRYSLEGEDLEFSLSNKSTGSRLSLFKHCEEIGKPLDRAFRLWHRKVINETTDSMALSCLQNQVDFETDPEFNTELCSFEYPLYYDLEE